MADVRTALRKNGALRLRAMGYTFGEIAEICGYASASAAWAAYREALEAMAAEPADELRRIERERLEIAYRGLMHAVERGDVKAVAAFVKVAARMARLLGLDLQSGEAGAVPVGRIRIKWRDDQTSD